MASRLVAILLLLVSGKTCAQTDSVRARLKFVVQGSIMFIQNWNPETGKLYSLNWYDYEEVKDHSIGTNIGIVVAPRLFKSNFYAGTGIIYADYRFGKFRFMSDHDARQNPNGFKDTLYKNYSLKNILIPVFLEIPFYADATIYFCMRAGLQYTLNLHEEYTQEYTTSTSPQVFTKEFSKTDLRYHSLGFTLGPGIELLNKKKSVTFKLSTGFDPGAIDSKSGYFLYYGPVFSFTAGIGYRL